jgi:hypothetical protein
MALLRPGMPPRKALRALGVQLKKDQPRHGNLPKKKVKALGKRVRKNFMMPQFLTLLPLRVID